MLHTIGIHASQISEGWKYAQSKAIEYLTELSQPVDLSDRESLLKSATTSLNSKVVSQYSSLLGPIAVDSVLHVIDPARDHNVDLRDIRIVKKVCFPKKEKQNPNRSLKIK